MGPVLPSIDDDEDPLRRRRLSERSRANATQEAPTSPASTDADDILSIDFSEDDTEQADPEVVKLKSDTPLGSLNETIRGWLSRHGPHFLDTPFRTGEPRPDWLKSAQHEQDGVLYDTDQADLCVRDGPVDEPGVEHRALLRGQNGRAFVYRESVDSPTLSRMATSLSLVAAGCFALSLFSITYAVLVFITTLITLGVCEGVFDLSRAIGVANVFGGVLGATSTSITPADKQTVFDFALHSDRPDLLDLDERTRVQTVRPDGDEGEDDPVYRLYHWEGVGSALTRDGAVVLRAPDLDALKEALQENQLYDVHTTLFDDLEAA